MRYANSAGAQRISPAEIECSSQFREPVETVPSHEATNPSVNGRNGLTGSNLSTQSCGV
jgi:hypothetical protein